MGVVRNNSHSSRRCTSEAFFLWGRDKRSSREVVLFWAIFVSVIKTEPYL